MLLVGWLLIVMGTGFFVTGAIGLLRFPDFFTRLHAVTKADSAGLGMIALGLALHAESVSEALLLVLVWLLVVGSSATNCQLLARYSCEQMEVDPATTAQEASRGPSS